MASINELPIEIIRNILAFIPFNSEDFSSAALVSRKFHGIMKQSDTTFVEQVTRNSFPVIYQLFKNPSATSMRGLHSFYGLDRDTRLVLHELKHGVASDTHEAGPENWEDILYKGLMIWCRFTSICTQYHVTDLVRTHCYHIVFTEECHLMFRYISAVLAEIIARTYQQPNAHHLTMPGPGALIRTIDASSFVNLTSAYHMMYPSPSNICRILHSTKYDPQDPACRTQIHTKIRELFFVARDNPNLVFYLDHYKPGPLAGNIVSWLCNHTNEMYLTNDETYHKHYFTIQRLLSRLFQAEGIASDIELLLYIAYHNLVPPQVVVDNSVKEALAAAERGESVERWLVEEAMKHSDLENILDKELKKGGSKLRQSMDGIGDVFSEAITAMNLWELRLANNLDPLTQ